MSKNFATKPKKYKVFVQLVQLLINNQCRDVFTNKISLKFKMLLAAASIILSPQPSLYFCVWNKAIEKVNDRLQKSAAFTVFHFKEHQEQATHSNVCVFSSFETLNGLLGPSLSPFYFKIHTFFVYTSN